MPNETPARSLWIKGLTPGLPERGKIKIGRKGDARESSGGKAFQLPQKLDHFVVTTLERGADGNFVRDEAIHATLGEAPTEIPVRLLFHDPELCFQSRLACYKGRTLWCTGDGQTAQRLDAEMKRQPVPCPCERSAPGYEGKDVCKVNGTLSVLIDAAPAIGGVWKLRTTSYNTVVGMMSALSLIHKITGGVLANLPLTLALRPKAVASPTDGKAQTVYVAALEYRGSMDALREEGYRAAMALASQQRRIEHIEDEARVALTPQPGEVLAGDDAADVVDEFYPDQAAAAVTAPRTTVPTFSRLDALEHGIPNAGAAAKADVAEAPAATAAAKSAPVPPSAPAPAAVASSAPKKNGYTLAIGGTVYEGLAAKDFATRLVRAINDLARAKERRALDALWKGSADERQRLYDDNHLDYHAMTEDAWAAATKQPTLV